MTPRRVVLILCVIGCGSPAPRPLGEPPVAIAVAPDAGPPALPVVEADAGEPADAAPPPDPCRGSAFDLDDLPKPCAGKRAESVPSSLTASLTTDEPSVRSGGEIGVTLTLVNGAAEPVEVDLRPQCAYLEIQAFRGKKRVDYINTSCGFGRGCGGGTYRLVVEAGGKLTKRFRYKAQVVRLDDKCKDVLSPLPAGRYDLKLDSGEGFVLHRALAELTAPLVVTR